VLSMSATPDPAELTPLLGEPSRGADPVTASEVVERLQLWKHGADTAVQTPLVLVNMACTADGRATIAGRSGAIGNRADRELFRALRTAVDAVLVGAGTARAEHYRQLVYDEGARRLRGERGLAAEPLACIVSSSLALSTEEVPLLADPAARVAILTPSSASLPVSAADVQYVRCTHEGQLDLPAALRELRGRLGVRTVLCEGGPHLNAELLGAELVDELWLSFAPKLAGGETGGLLRIVCGAELHPPVELELIGALTSESQLLLRYRVGGAGAVARSV
jgi:riboflavin biosynthesis pyrimidine reductase